MATFDLLIQGGQVVDGTGAPSRRADVATQGDRIAAVGDLAGAEAARWLDASGLTVGPGLFDTHTHDDGVLLAQPDDAVKLRQGVTTTIAGNCGFSLFPCPPNARPLLEAQVAGLLGQIDLDQCVDYGRMRRQVERQGLAHNAAFLVGHGALRTAVLGHERRPPTSDEQARMEALLAEQLDQGALGLSYGLIYPPGAYAATAELVGLARVVGQRGGICAAHIRNESHHLLDAVAEIVQVAEQGEAPLVLSHHKASGRANWGKVVESLALVDAARARGVRLALDVYPYTAGSTNLNALLPPWMHEGGIAALVERLKDPAVRARLQREFAEGEDWENFGKLAGWDKVVVAGVQHNPAIEGQSIAAIAAARGGDPLTTVCDLLVEENGVGVMIIFIMTEADVATVLRHPRAMVGSDGIPGGRRPHPRLYGTFPRILAKYVREDGVLTLEQAIHKMSGLPAEVFGFQDRGTIAPGQAADLVLFDPATVRDTATYDDPRRFPEGIPAVVVNGALAVAAGEPTGVRPGRLLGRAG